MIVTPFPLALSSRYLVAVEAEYGANPYHNSVHAAHVVRGFDQILTCGGFAMHLAANKSVMLASLLAAVCSFCY
jgi:hypothetical protein